MTFEDAMVELVNATDGNGLPVHLYRGNWTAESLREATRNFAYFARHVVPEGEGPMPEVIFLAGFSNRSDSENVANEAGYWENLAKLAIATASAIREGR